MSVTKKSPHAKLARLAEGVLGRSVARIEKPGGSRRQSCRLVLDDDERVIATRRDELSQAVLEVRVLKLLADNDAPVPSVLASRGDFLVQSHLDGPRLSQALDGAGPATVERLLDDGLASLTRLHQTGSALGLDESVPRRGHKRGWIEGLIERPAVFSRVFDLEPPDLPHEEAGLLKDYMKLFEAPSPEHAIQFLERLGERKRVANKRACPCGSGRRVGRCHHLQFEKLRQVRPRGWYRAEARALRTYLHPAARNGLRGKATDSIPRTAVTTARTHRRRARVA